MPTLHYISREVLRKHDIECLPLEVNNDVIPPPNKKTKIADSTDVGTIRAEDLLNAATPDYLMNINNDEDDRKPAAVVNLPKYVEPHSSVQPNCEENNIIERVDFSIEEIFNSIDRKNTEINDTDNDKKNAAANSIHKIDCLKTVTVKVEQVDDLMKSDDTDANQDVRGKHHDSYLNHSTTNTTAAVTSASSTTASRDDSFFARVHELKAYKEKHGHLNVQKKEDQRLYLFCHHMRGTRRAIIAGKGKKAYALNDDKIAALDAIGFDWKLGAGAFLRRVHELKAFKEKHGHLNVLEKHDQSLYGFCNSMRRARRFLITGKGTDRKLTEDQIAVLDAIGFDWKLFGRRSQEVESIMERGDVVSIIVAPGRLWLTVAYVNDFIHGLDLLIRGGAKITAINPACAFCDKVSVGDIIVAFDGKRVLRVEDVSIGTERTRELVIIQMSRHITAPTNVTHAADDGNFRADDQHDSTRTTADSSLQSPTNSIIGETSLGFLGMNRMRRRIDFFGRIVMLKSYKEKHGHLNVRKKENESLYMFCLNLRQSRTAIITGKGKIHNRLDDDRIAALDAIGFDWKLLGTRSQEVESMIERGDAVPIIVAPGRLWLTVAYVNDFIHGLDLLIRGGAKITAINPACTFRDKVSVGDIIIAFDGKRVLRVEDVSIGTERTRELIIIRMTASVISPVI
jgi:hypothetical protein